MRGERVVILTNKKTGKKERVNIPFNDSMTGKPITLKIGDPLYSDCPSFIITKILKTLYKPKTKF
ncbi:unnamed protein product [marine sediment metagenome]|uniref:Uncharacterized protein n=1 Tax=marine sediment metagenome TaxID=412755 RepID=X1Q6M1_9ZZZZ